jgi:hypothetical protein
MVLCLEGDVDGVCWASSSSSTPLCRCWTCPMEHDEGHVDPQASFESVEKWAGKMQITDPDASFANWQRDRHGFVVDPQEP